METDMTQVRTLGAIAITLILSAAPVLAETMMYKADLKGASEVPPTDSGGTGNAMVTLDTEGKTVAWKITYAGLTGDVSAAHFHGPAAVGANAGPAVDISGKIEEGS